MSPPRPTDPPVRRIAVLRALYLGDLLLAVPALRALRAGFPAAEITLLGLPWAEPFARRFGRYVDRFVVFPGYPGIAEAPVDPMTTRRFIAAQRAYGYDLVVQMHGSGRTSNAVALALGGRVTAGYYEHEPPAGLTIGAPYPYDQPEVRRNLGLAGLLGCGTEDTKLEFPLERGDHAEAEALLGGFAAKRRPWIGLHAGSRSPARRWPAEYFATVGDYLAREYGARIILTGGPGDAETVRAVAERMATRPLDVSGATSLGGLAALIQRLDLCIGNDTGPSHLACAVGTPSVTIFGPADPHRWAPLDHSLHPIARRSVACSPCGHWECPIDHRCLRGLRPQEVIQTARRLLAGRGVLCAV